MLRPEGVSYLAMVISSALPSRSFAIVCTRPLPYVLSPTSLARPFSWSAAASTSEAEAVFRSTSTRRGTSAKGPSSTAAKVSETPARRRTLTIWSSRARKSPAMSTAELKLPPRFPRRSMTNSSNVSAPARAARTRAGELALMRGSRSTTIRRPLGVLARDSVRPSWVSVPGLSLKRSCVRTSSSASKRRVHRSSRVPSMSRIAPRASAVDLSSPQPAGGLRPRSSA
mmetsp:Transcript_22719/g.66965  ORF Transcript_22719/g.66965 Transcript_22719/m.66965 type:complete len:227 (+) Transcript_22719:141-821(+)